MTVTNWTSVTRKRGQITVEEREHVEIRELRNMEKSIYGNKTQWHHGPDMVSMRRVFWGKFMQDAECWIRRKGKRTELKIYGSRREEWRLPVRIISTNSWSFRSLNVNLLKHPVFAHTSTSLLTGHRQHFETINDSHFHVHSTGRRTVIWPFNSVLSHVANEYIVRRLLISIIYLEFIKSSSCMIFRSRKKQGEVRC